MNPKLVVSLKAFFTQHITKILLAIAAFFSPIEPLLIAAFVFSICDFITGLLAARKKAKTAGLKTLTDWRDSKKMQKKVFDLLFYLLSIILSYYFEKLFLEFIHFPLSRLVAFIILSVEFWSNMENLSVITGMPLNKEAFFQLANKIRGGGTATPDNTSSETNQETNTPNDPSQA
ncbi:MAG: phage holin family protein [Bacteroidetes bacterium]|nr:phage holin family protein [Bacteroidota bacterium]